MWISDDGTAHHWGDGMEYTSKATIQSVIRAAVWREENEAGFLHVPVKFTFVSEG